MIYCAANGLTVVLEAVDHAPANDLDRRAAWQDVLDDAAQRGFDLLLLRSGDRVSRSAEQWRAVVDALERHGVALRSIEDESGNAGIPHRPGAEP